MSLLLAGTKFNHFQIHDLAGINFSDFMISSSGTYQVLSGFPIVFSDDESSQKTNIYISRPAVLKVQ